MLICEWVGRPAPLGDFAGPETSRWYISLIPVLIILYFNFPLNSFLILPLSRLGYEIVVISTFFKIKWLQLCTFSSVSTLISTLNICSTSLSSVNKKSIGLNKPLVNLMNWKNYCWFYQLIYLLQTCLLFFLSGGTYWIFR